MASYDWQQFEVVFQAKPDYSPDQKQADAALKHRKEFGGKLFFDRIWSTLNLQKATKAYPPRSNNELKELWKRIVDAKSSDEQKLALLYYIIRDCRNITLEKTFLQKTYLPEKYQLLVTGLWELDHCQFPRALDCLTDPTLIPPTFPDDVLMVLLRHPKATPSQAMAYYVTVQPPLQDETVLIAYFDLLVRTSVSEAYDFARQSSQHKRLFESLVTSIHEAEPGDARAAGAVQLIGMPFTEDEERWFEECLLQGSASKCNGAKDSILMRRLATGRLQSDSTPQLARYKGNKTNGANWDDIRTIVNG
ncbi:uncharacterized protein HMPREF1541_09162 [Cyphellophora europaea CBS 101466]|uniref:ELYS-like domain-containing protein n=1 Tax=Cyphellophora europaea (strain CBS 101466) TaxID=1220924 RepID=W2S9D2_CYPE1|nr:uncharacterized protein HMPREF1541_09162 [Cyphellophora europaea CBS 101466]ETN45331.1 hypothetical protein HMPREF1541_09162 [Cyphellophora europaea CBS 101466]